MTGAKFRVDDHVRVTAVTLGTFDKAGVVVEIMPASEYPVKVAIEGQTTMGFAEHELVLAESAGEVIDEMLAESGETTEAQRKMQDKINYSVHKAERARGGLGIIPEVQWEAAKEAMKDGAAGFKKNLADSVEQDAHDDHAAPTLIADDKLRMIADTVAGQSPFGTELANFRKRLLAILSIGERP